MPGLPIVGDLQLTEDGTDLVLVTGPKAVAQLLKSGAQIFRGSWRYDLAVGLPYFQEILVAGPSVERVRRRFFDFLTATVGVVSVRSVAVRFDRAKETVFVDYSVIVESGETLTDSLDFVVVN